MVLLADLARLSRQWRSRSSGMALLGLGVTGLALSLIAGYGYLRLGGAAPLRIAAQIGPIIQERVIPDPATQAPIIQGPVAQTPSNPPSNPALAIAPTAPSAPTAAELSRIAPAAGRDTSAAEPAGGQHE